MTENPRTRILTAASILRVVPMGSGLEEEASRLRRALPDGILAREDPKRRGFYSVDGHGSELYIHLHEPEKTAYVLARLQGPDFPAHADPALAVCVG